MTLPLRPQDMSIAHAIAHAHASLANGFYARHGKRALDIILALALLPVAAIIVTIGALGLMAQGHKPFFTQQRLGRNGHSFRIWKLRTMAENADVMLQRILDRDPMRRAEWNSTQKLKNDPRVTTLGAILRKTSIDELPQLLNVLRGDMSMIGPRPMMLEQAAIYGPDLQNYLSLRPGITGQWQVTERNNADFSKRAATDTDYARHLNFRTDLGIAARTITTMLRGTGH